MTIRVLHLSDLHARADWTTDQQEIVAAMLDDVETLAEHQTIDAMIFSGDLAFSGAPAQYELATAALLDPLTERLGIPRDRMLLVPGNHDVHRKDVDAIYELGLQQTLTDREVVNRVLDDDTGRRRACARLDNFRTFHDAFFAAGPPTAVAPLAVTRRFDVRGVDIGLLGLDSAWRCSDDHDRGRLVVGDRQVQNGLRAIQPCDVRLVALHHPLDWLTDFDATSTRLLLEQGGAIVLSGHEHASNPTLEITMRGQAVYSRAGCLYETHSYANTYTLIDLDLDRGVMDINLRTWWRDGRRSFAPAVHLAPDGCLSFPLPGASRRPIARPTGAGRSSTAVPGPDDSFLPRPEKLRQAALRAYTPLYKTHNTYTFDVLDVRFTDGLLRVRLRYQYGIVNPTDIRLGHRPGLTPVRPLRIEGIRIDGEPIDLTNPDIYTERGIIVPIELEPRSETEVDLEAEVDYRLPDAEVFLTYLPSLSFEVNLRYRPDDLRFIGEPLMPEALTRHEGEADETDRVPVTYQAKGPVLAYWGIKLDWQAAQVDNL
jgi:predicted phosphodiesterase